MKWEDSIKVNTERRLLCIHVLIKLKKSCGKEKLDDGHLLCHSNWFASPIEGVVGEEAQARTTRLG